MTALAVGFTGSRVGMTGKQSAAVEALLVGWSRSAQVTVHHGDCIGADRIVHDLAAGLGLPVIIHPPSTDTYRAFCKADHDGDVLLEPRDYMARNRDIVRAATVLVATPRELSEPPVQRGQGTWSTIRFARDRLGTSTLIVWPNGMSE